MLEELLEIEEASGVEQSTLALKIKLLSFQIMLAESDTDAIAYGERLAAEITENFGSRHYLLDELKRHGIRPVVSNPAP